MPHKKWKLPTVAIKQRAVKLVKTYTNNGTTLSKARSLAAKTVGYTPATIAKWEKDNVTTSTTNTNKNGFISSINVRTTTGAIVQLSLDDINNIAKLAGNTH